MKKEEIKKIETKHDLSCYEVGAKTSASSCWMMSILQTPVGACIARPQNTDMLQINNQNKFQNHVGARCHATQNAITLISLVITIIILLILAGVTINLTLGENGIFGLAEKAGKNYMNAQEQEKKMLANIKVGEYVNGTNETITIDEYNKIKNEYDKFKTDIVQALNSKNCNLNQIENNDQIIKSINGLLVGNIQKIAEDLSGKTTQSVSINNIEGYEYLTEDNFILVLKGLGSKQPKDGEQTMKITKTYDSTTGQLTISKCKNYYTLTDVTVWAIYDVYIIK